MAKTLRKIESCSNCGKELKEDNYCPECGQQNTTKNVEISMLLRDFVDDFFTLDSRLFKTIVPLLFKPGFLTVEYNSGKRIKYLPPLRMYLVLSILFFIIPNFDREKVNIETDDEYILVEDDHMVVNYSQNKIDLDVNKFDMSFVPARFLDSVDLMLPSNEYFFLYLKNDLRFTPFLS